MPHVDKSMKFKTIHTQGMSNKGFWSTDGAFFKEFEGRRPVGGTGEVAPGRLRGDTREAPRKLLGGNGAVAGARYEVLRTTKRSSEDLTCHGARGPANLFS